MTTITAENELSQALAHAGLSIDALDPWQAWKVFKAFLRRELSGGYDAAAVQIVKDPTDPASCSLLFVRQLSERDSGGEDLAFWRLVVEFKYGTTLLPFEDSETWTLDYRTIEEFASVVEGLPLFQRVVAMQARSTELFTEDL